MFGLRSSIINALLCSVLIRMATGTRDFLALLSSPLNDFCVTNSSSAMYYKTTNNSIETEGHNFLPPTDFTCDFDGLFCPLRFDKGNWTTAFVDDEPIFDSRWEDLPIEELAFTPYQSRRLSFRTLSVLNDKKFFRRIISLKGREAHFFICDSEDLEESNCYWLVLQGWLNRFTVMRKCKKGEIGSIFPHGQCIQRIAEKMHPEDVPLYMNTESWSHIFIERRDRVLYLGVYKEGKMEKILQYEELNDLFQMNYLLGQSRGDRRYDVVFFKLHKTSFIQTKQYAEPISQIKLDARKNEEFCISFLVSTCPNCEMTVILFDDHAPRLKEDIPPTNGSWVHYKFAQREVTSREFVMWIKLDRTDTNGSYETFWRIDNFRTCHKEEYRRTLRIEPKISECRLVDNSLKVSEENATNYIPGHTAIPCSFFDSPALCRNLKICENVKGLNKCYCAPGYTGGKCENECPEGWYGYSCSQKCGACIPEGKCNMVNGSCECSKLFEGDTCHIPKSGQYLGSAPEVIRAESNVCEIQWNSKNFFGKTRPRYYLIQYSSDVENLTWFDYGDVKMLKKLKDVEKSIIENLSFNQNYKIRILVSDERERIKEWNSLELPFTICKTKAKVLNKPYNLTTSWNLDNTMELLWNYPRLSKDKLKFFYIGIILTSGHSFVYKLSVPKEKLTYSYKFSTPFRPATDITIEVTPYTTRLGPETAVLRDSSYPEEPILTTSNIFVSNYTKTTITLTLDITQTRANSTEVEQLLYVQIVEQSPDMKDSNLQEQEDELNAPAEINLTKHSMDKFNLTIGSEDEVPVGVEGLILNKRLRESSYYKINVMMVNQYKGKSRHSMLNIPAFTRGNSTDGSLETTEGHSSGGYGVFFLIALLLFFIAAAVIVIMKCRRRVIFGRKSPLFVSFRQTSNLRENIYMDTQETVTLHKPGEGVNQKLKIMNSTNTNPVHVDSDLYSRPIKKLDFENYVKSSIRNGELVKQFDALPVDLTKLCLTGQLECFKPKNRFNNIIPYDINRVVLRNNIQKKGNDYINASYVMGPGNKKSYIAAQGPKSSTVLDFWLMVWQENIRNIVMLVNLNESGIKKVEKYWPNHNEDFQMGNIHIYHHSSEQYVDYETNVFRLVCDGKERKVLQYYFTGWPDNAVPNPYQSFIPVMRKTLEISSKSPILVHCCSGSSQTGVFILCHMCLLTAAENDSLDIFKTAHELREQRVNMIYNETQYKFAHLLILEFLFGLELKISCSDKIEMQLAYLTSFQALKDQITCLNDSAWRDMALVNTPYYEQPMFIDTSKNKVAGIFPAGDGAIELERYPAADERSRYINAVRVDGYRFSQRYIVTQQPMPNTLKDFWRMIFQYSIEAIISLNDINLKDKKSCIFWPTEEDPIMSPVDFIILSHDSTVKSEIHDLINVRVSIHGNKEESKKITIIALKYWNFKAKLPDNTERFLKFFGYADSISRCKQNVVVTCYDGCLASGIYVAAAYLIEMITLEKCFDMYAVVRAVRRNRQQFIVDEEQLAFLYQLALAYWNGYLDYANFEVTNQQANIYDYIECNV